MFIFFFCYFSPTGAALTNLSNVKEYLLKSGTCKCGLPCPLRPELFFNFDIQVPNMHLQASSDDGLTCMHVRRNNHAPTVVTRRKIVTKEWVAANAVQQSQQQHQQIQAPQQIYINNNKIITQPKYVKQHISTIGAINQNNIAVDGKLSNLKLTRSPPWRKSATSVTTTATATTGVTLNSQPVAQHDNVVINVNERVPPLPQQHIPQQQHQQIVINARDDVIKNNRIIKTTTLFNSNKNKKRPNFKDDPTGYLDQQTAILQNSILSVPSPDIPVANESPNIIQQNNIRINENPIQLFNTNQVIGLNSNGSNGNFSTYPIQNNQIIIQQNDHGSTQNVTAASSNQIISCNPQTSTFCGQSVTPNGMIQMSNGMVRIQHQSSGSNNQPLNDVIQQQQHIQLRQQIQQHDQLVRQTQQQMQQNTSFVVQENEKFVNGSPRQSPVSSSTTRFSQTPDGNHSPDNNTKGPVQGGTISTSNDSTSSSTSSSPVENLPPETSFRLTTYAASETAAKNTITSVLAGRAITATTSVNPSNNFTLTGGSISIQQQQQSSLPQQNSQFSHPKTTIQNLITVPNNSISEMQQIQQINRDESTTGNQFIMTSNGQIILMSNKSQHQSQQPPPSTHQHHQTATNNQVIINSNAAAATNTASQQFSIENQHVQIISQQNLISNNQQNKTYNNLLSPQTAAAPSPSQQQQQQQQQTVVLNTIPSSFLLQPNFSVDGNQVIINQNNTGGSSNFIHQQQQIQLSPDSKRRLKKRKSNISPHSPIIQNQAPAHHQQPPQIQVQSQNQSMLQITSQYSPQNFQLSPSLSGITIIPNQNKNTQQQIIMSNNGQIIQPINLIGQQLLVPAGLVVAPDTTLLQIQNCGPTILTQQGMVLRAPSPQNKSFLSPNSHHSGQQFIVNSNGQISPVSQIYTTPVGLSVVPHSNSGQTYVQQNTTIVQQQTTMMNSGNASGGNSGGAVGASNIGNKTSVDQDGVGHSVSTQTAQVQPQISSLPPDTTTHSPRSPERPTSSKSNNSDQMNMVRRW